MQDGLETFKKFVIRVSFVYTKQPLRIAQVLKQVYPVDPSNVDDELVERFDCLISTSNSRHLPSNHFFHPPKPTSSNFFFYHLLHFVCPTVLSSSAFSTQLKTPMHLKCSTVWLPRTVTAPRYSLTTCCPLLKCPCCSYGGQRTPGSDPKYVLLSPISLYPSC